MFNALSNLIRFAVKFFVVFNFVEMLKYAYFYSSEIKKLHFNSKSDHVTSNNFNE